MGCRLSRSTSEEQLSASEHTNAYKKENTDNTGNTGNDTNTHSQRKKHKDKGWTIGFFESHPREDWVKFLGDRYVALKVISPANKEKKVTVLFTIEELRNNLYVHYHGFEWNDKLEDNYVQSNKDHALSIEDKVIDAELLESPKTEIMQEELID